MFPLVSIVIPVYNQEKYIKACVESVLEQDYENLEIIVVDDGSTDATPAILKEFGKKIKYIRQENRGPACALNCGIRLARGEFVGWLGSDDMYLPGKIKHQIQKFQENNFLALIYTDYIIIDSEGKELRVSQCPSLPPEQLSKVLLVANFINGSTVLMRKKCHEKVGYYDENLKASMDGDMWFRLLEYGYKFGHIPVPYVKYRWHPANISHKFRLMQKYRDKVQLKAFKAFSSQGLFNNIPELEQLSFAFAKQLSFRSAIATIEKAMETEGKSSIRQTFLWTLFKIMNNSFFIGLIRLVIKMKCKIKYIDKTIINEPYNAKNYWEKRLEKNWGLHGVGCINYGIYYNQWLYKVRKRVFIDHIRTLNLDFKNIKVLDIGSGTGFYLDFWKSHGVKSVTASDIASIAVQRLKKSYPEFSVVQLDIGNTLATQNFIEESFDVVTAFDVLFHIVDDEAFRRALFNISYLVKPMGYFIFSDNFLHGKTFKSDRQVSKSIEEISSVLKEAGFGIIKRTPMFFLMNAPIDTKSSLPLALWRLLTLPVQISNLVGFLYGAILFPIEIFLIKIFKESPTTEMMICQKIKSAEIV